MQQAIIGTIRSLFQASRRLENNLLRNLFGGGHPNFDETYLELLYADAQPLPRPFTTDHNQTSQSLKWDGLLWGVPKKRTSIEKRWCKQMGAANWYWKMLIPKYNLRICENCGHHYEAKHLCRNCYEKVKAETDLIRNKIESDIGNNPEDKGVTVLYQNEHQLLKSSNTSLPKGHMIVEVDKLRPAWFSSNLLQKTTAEPDPVTTTVMTTKPNLG